MAEPFVTNILSHKYDTALDYHVTMYDNLPYKRDSDYCNNEKVALTSGKVLKYFLYFPVQEAAVIDNKDDIMEQYLLGLQLKQQKVLKNNTAEVITDKQEVTDEQIQSLLDDQPEDSFDTSEEIRDDLSNTVNPFADVEDW